MTTKKATKGRQRETTPKAIQDTHELLGWMLPHLDKMPRNRRFTLGSRIEDGLLFVLERLVEAAYTRGKVEALRQANLRLEVVRHLWRLAFENQAVAGKSWQHGAGLMIELGRQIGGWQKASAT